MNIKTLTTHLLPIVLLISAPLVFAQESQQPQESRESQEVKQPEETAAPSERMQAVQVTVVNVSGRVQFRTAPQQPWRELPVDQKLDAGADIRTGVRSSVTLKIPPDQTMTLDRLGTVRVLEVLQNPQKSRTSLGMKYGRTRIKLEAGGREHETTVSTPGATLAVRGSDVTIQQDPLIAFASGNGHLQYHTAGNDRTLDFGNDGVNSTVHENRPNPGTLNRASSTIDPSGLFSGRDRLDILVLEQRPEVGGNDYANRLTNRSIPPFPTLSLQQNPLKDAPVDNNPITANETAKP